MQIALNLVHRLPLVELVTLKLEAKKNYTILRMEGTMSGSTLMKTTIEAMCLMMKSMEAMFSMLL